MIAAIGLALSKFGNWVANNKAVQWSLGILLFLFGLVLWGERREGQGRKDQKLKHRERDLDLQEEASAVAEKIIEEEDIYADRAQEAGIRAGRAEPNGLERMSDGEWELTFGRPREAGDPGYRGKG